MSGPVALLDVFDTVLTRRVGSPVAVFYFAGRAAREQQLTTVSPEAFVEARRAAQKSCRQRSPKGEITLDEISLELADRLALSRDKPDALSAIELASETRLICPVPGVHAWLANVRQKSPRVIFVSDMYLPPDFIRARLVEHGCWHPGDALYVSCAYGACKSTGELFRVIMEKEKLSAKDLHHTGDHAVADYAAPRKLGISATLWTGATRNRYEQHLEDSDAATDGVASLHAGASRLARLGTPATSPAARAIRDVAAGVAGPVLSSYVSWVLREARRRQVARLYFVARDGHLLLQLARQLAPRFYPGVELRYLHGSRQAWHLPGIFSLGPAELDWLFDPTDSLSVTGVCARVSLSPDEISTPLSAAGFSRESWNRDLSPHERTQLRGVMQNQAVADLVQQKAAAARELLLAYLRQEKLLSADRCALVDVGWHGRAQHSLEKVILAAGFTAPVGFYFGLNGTSGLTGLGERQAWFFDRRSGAGLANALSGIEPLLEMFCTADHGVTTGYTRNARGIEPVLRTSVIALQSWGWATLQAAVSAYGRELAVAPDVETDEDAIRAMCLSVLKLFWEKPTHAEAGAWGAFPYEDDQTGSLTRPLAAALPWSQATEILLHGRNGPHRAAWWHGSLELTPPLRRGLLAFAHRLRGVARAGKQNFS